MIDAPNPAKGCLRCGKPLPLDAPQGLCAACLLTAGTETLSYSAGDAPTIWGGDDSDSGPRLVAGQAWGPYRIGRLLGRGGMGEVYEAEHSRTGRRLALKVLRSRLQNADERARFLREGQLAASISHPHTVYIFGSEEISGTPVISMELTPGGTLKDRMAAQGPLSPADAASAALDIISGLDAAHAAGILHRDIKPSNCFIDSDGAVKVGDFGLSISTLARDVQENLGAHGFQGTPHFAPPEQLRGEPLDVRADIYAVGATLYYLLTGRPPFDANNLRELAAKVTDETPQPLRSIRREIPKGLASVVLSCLAKEPSRRPASYAALAEALRPFSPVGHVPATLGIRFLAGVVDNIILSVAYLLILAVAGVDMLSVALSPLPTSSASLWMWPLLILYLCMEGLWGATPGKRLLGLRVRAVDGGRAPWASIIRRHLIFNAPSILWTLPILAYGAERYSAFLLAHIEITVAAAVGSTITPLGIFFMTARRQNGWAAVHDLGSRTRLVIRRSRNEGPLPAPAGSTTRASEEGAMEGLRFGPFTVLSAAGGTAEGHLYAGVDPLLRRRVWICTCPPGTPTIGATRRDASRPGRLHWLSGRRSPDENWDVYEAPEGRPFSALNAPLAWPAMKLSLQQLATELKASATEKSLPELGLDRVWRRNDGRMVLLDFPVGPAVAAPAGLTPVELLAAVATHGLTLEQTASDALPLSARSMIERWSATPPPQLDEARAELVRVSSGLERVSKWRRTVLVGFAAAPILFIATSSLLTLPAMFRPMTRETIEMVNLLRELHKPASAAVGRFTEPEIRNQVERYLAGRHKAALRDDVFWKSPIIATENGYLRDLATDIGARYPSVSAEEVSRAAAAIAPEIRKAEPRLTDLQALASLVNFIAVFGAVWAIFFCVVSALAVPGGVAMRLLGLAAVTRNGREIGRGRSLARIFLAWLPTSIWIAWIVSTFNNIDPGTLGVDSWGSSLVGLSPLLAGAIWAVSHPAQGLHDRLLGIWIVPR